MDKEKRTLEEARYELDSEYLSQFSMLNDAIFTNKTGIEFVGLDCVKDNKAEYANWLIKIEQGKKIGEVMDRIPFGILNKTITGLGATTLEINNQERNSIIVVPTKALAYSKCKSANLSKGDEYAFYVGSPIKDITSNISAEKIITYLNNGNSCKKKFLVVADSLPLLIDTLSKNNINVYNDYFCLIDEIDSMQADSAYRPKLESVIDYYFKFNRRNRSAVSATLNEFSNPLLERESMVTTIWRENPRRDIDLIYTNYVDDVAIETIKEKLQQSPNNKILIAYNSLDGIINIIQQIKVTKSNCGILCSERSNDKVKEYLEDTDNVIDENGNLQKQIVFMTCAYFAGIDIQAQCHLITISSYRQPFTYLSPQRMTQIAGRCRKGNLSETIIYDIPPKKPTSIFDTKEDYRNNLIKRAKAYVEFLNTTKESVNQNTELEELGNFIDSFIDYAAKAKVDDKDYPIKIIRQDYITKKFVPAYFNIDALVEKWELTHTLYINEKKLQEELKSQNNNVNLIPYKHIKKEDHDSTTILQIKERNKERRTEYLEQLKPLLLEWSRSDRNEYHFQEIYKNQDKAIQKLCDEFKKLSPYIDNERLFDDLFENYTDGRKLRNYVNSAIFHVLSQSNGFKSHVLAKFNYYEIEPKLGQRGIGKITAPEKIRNLKEIFRMQLKKTDISNDTLSEYFNCFFDTSRTGGINKIIGLNPQKLPEPIQEIDDQANLLQLFIFP